MESLISSTNLTFGEWLYLNRRRKDLTQDDLAEALGVKSQTISNWENSSGIPKLMPQQTQSLCVLLECSLDDLARVAAQTAERIKSA
ncbi:helix-turn-helix transcriptional regulator [Leptolyngbya sp. AN03gr2]|uniref:helix-turn-helix transcriptional regulator n=1 Tax=unclassified Leptolyngbya TaxID=2650499 RepID=UPI003D311B33